jgi:hypothetical protein
MTNDSTKRQILTDSESPGREPPVAVPDTTDSSERLLPRLAPWMAVAIALALQWSFFSAFLNREVLWAYPTGYDQSYYLAQTYETFDHMLKEGLWNGLTHGLLMKTPQGKMIHLQASLLMLLTGPSRMSALTLNFIYFALLECMAVYTLRWLTGRWPVAFLGLGVLLTTHSRFLMPGGMMDFRPDNISLCLYGIFVCMVVRSRVFLSKPWSLAAGATAGLLILFRFLTALTVACVMGTILLCLCLRAWRGTREVRIVSIERLRGLLRAGGLIAVLVAPAIWSARKELFGYYVGQVTLHNDKIRAVEYGAVGPLKYWLYYVRSLIFDHIGGLCLIVSALLILTLFLAWRLRPSTLKVDSRPDNRVTVLFLVIAFLTPLLILTGYPVRNPIVANILTIPALCLMMATIVWFAGRRSSASPAFSRVLAVLATVAVCCAGYTEFSMATRRNAVATDSKSVHQVLDLYEEIGARSEKLAWTQPRVNLDRVQEYLVAAHVTSLTYERRGVYVRPQALMGADIRGMAADAAIAAIRDSDFAVITDVDSPEGPGFAFPFNTSMKQIEPQLKATAERYLMPLKHFEVYSHHFTLYIRPSGQLEGESGGWITSRGVTIRTPSGFLHRKPNVELTGTTFGTEYLGKVRVRAQLEADNRPAKGEPTEVDLPVIPKSVVNYRILIKVNPDDVPVDGEPRIWLSFDKFWVPKNVGMNEDLRQLVIMAPKQIKLLP